MNESVFLHTTNSVQGSLYLITCFILQQVFQCLLMLLAKVRIFVRIPLSLTESELRLLAKQRQFSPETSLCGKTRGAEEASPFSQLARPTAARALSHREARVIERRR